MLVGHEHEGTIHRLLRNIREKEAQGITVHLHKVLAHSGVRGNEKADRTAKLACDDENSAEMARGRVLAVKKYPFWIRRIGSDLQLGDRQSVAAAIRGARQEKVADSVNVGPWVSMRDGPDTARTSRTKAFWGGRGWRSDQKGYS